MPELVPILTKENINKLVESIAQKISSDYQGQELVLIGVLKGAFVFLADLIRYITIPVQVDFVRISSYGSSSFSSGKISLSKEIEIDINGKHVLIVEDIVDTGLTLGYLIDYVKSFGAKSVKICALIDKLERRKAKINIDYVGYAVEKGFLVGYGLDYAEKYRWLPEIYHLQL